MSRGLGDVYKRQTEDAAVIDSAKQELAHQQVGAFLRRMERMGYDREQAAQLVRSWKEEA